MNERLLEECEALRKVYYAWSTRDRDEDPEEYNVLTYEVCATPHGGEPIYAPWVHGSPLWQIGEAAVSALAVLMGSESAGRAVWDACINNGEDISYNVAQVEQELAMEAFDAEQALLCHAAFTTGGSDPYGTTCTQPMGHDGSHIAPHPMAMGELDTSVITWRGGGSVAGDPLPYRDVTGL